MPKRRAAKPDGDGAPKPSAARRGDSGRFTTEPQLDDPRDAVCRLIHDPVVTEDDARLIEQLLRDWLNGDGGGKVRYPWAV
jgi:hypothetical protein